MKSFYQTTILFFLTIFLISCSEKFQRGTADKNKVDIKNVDDVLQNLTIKPQTFQIDPTKESVLKCGKGTNIFIPANVLVFADNSKVTGPVNISVIECYSFSEMIGSRLNTVSGMDLLTTAGMVKVSAESNGKELKILAGSAIGVSFPKISEKDSMDIFYGGIGRDSSMNWIPDYVDYDLKQNKSKGNTEGYSIGEGQNLPDSFYILYPAVYGQTFSGNSFYTKLKGLNQNVYSFALDEKKFSQEEIIKYRDLKLTGAITFEIRPDGQITGIRVMDGSYDNELTRKVISNMSAIPMVDIESWKKDTFQINHSLTYSGIYTFSFGIAKYLDIKAYKIYVRDKFKKYKTDANYKFKENDLEDFSYAVTNLGWINCDRFLNDPNEKVNFMVQGNFDKGTSISLIFSDTKSIMPLTKENGKYYFPNVPLDKNAKIVALKCENGRPMMTNLKTKVSKDPVTISEFKETNMEEIEKVLNE